MSAADLSRLLGGSRNLGAMILRGERKLTLNHVRTLSRRFHVSADLFCREALISGFFRLAIQRDCFNFAGLNGSALSVARSLVEHHVANVSVEGSNPFARSIFICTNYLDHQ